MDETPINPMLKAMLDRWLVEMADYAEFCCERGTGDRLEFDQMLRAVPHSLGFMLGGSIGSGAPPEMRGILVARLMSDFCDGLNTGLHDGDEFSAANPPVAE